MVQRLEPVPEAWHSDLEPLRPAIEATLGGFVPNSLYIMAHNPDLLAGFGLLSRGVFRGSAHTRLGGLALLRAAFRQFIRSLRLKRDPPINDALRALIFLASSLSAGCLYCQAHSITQALDRCISKEKLDAILSFEDSPHYSPAERAALALAFAAAQIPNASTTEHFAELKLHFTTQQIIDIVAAIAYIGFLNRWNDTLATTLEARPALLARENLTEKGWQIGKHGGR